MKIRNLLKKSISKQFQHRLMSALLMLITSQLIFAQSGLVTGKVQDAQGEPIIGASIAVKGSTTGTITDINGTYKINVPAEKTVLVFSYIGMGSKTVTVGNQKVINVRLEDAAVGLNEVVAIGYAKIKKSDVTGAMSQISEKTLKERPVQNAISAIQGKAAGVDVQTNVRPGTESKVEIRGSRSLMGGNGPLYVVDGIVLMGSINDINPNDIASMEILKDASSTAIYGSRGANGVILISTKSAKKGKISVDYSGSISFDQINSTTNWASAGEVIDRMRQANINGASYANGTDQLKYPNPIADRNLFGHNDIATIAAINSAYQWTDNTFTTPVMRNSTTEEIAAGYPVQVPVYNSANIPTTDWIGKLTKTGVTHNHQIGISSGTDKSKTYFSLGYYKNDGTQKNQGYTRYTSRINTEITPFKWLTIGSSLNAMHSLQNYGTVYRKGSATGPNDSYGIALSQYLMAQPYDANGVLNEYPGGNNKAPIWNPFIDIENTTDLTRKTSIQGNVFGDVRFTPWLKYHVNFGSNLTHSRAGTYQNSMSTLRRTVKTGAATYSTSENFKYLIENLLYFDKKFGQHSVGATLMQSAEYNRYESEYADASGIFYDTAYWYNLRANTSSTPDGYGSEFSENTMQSYMARINYSLLDRYLLTASLRADGASMLADGHKWATFPSLALAWKMQEESFIKKFEFVNELKLRFGMGTSGNSVVGAYSSAGPLAQYNYAFGNTAAVGMLPYEMPNPLLGWERTTQYNAGLDFEVLDNRISGTIEAYMSNTSDLLMTRPLPAIVGYPNVKTNVGKTRGKGIEFTLSTKNIVTKDFMWSTDFNVSSYKSEIVSLINGKEDMRGNNWFIGKSINVFAPNYQTDGLWQNTLEDLAEIALWKANGYSFQPGQIKPVEGGTPDHKLTIDDQTVIASRDPKCILGLTNTFTYKGLELSFFLYARLGQKYFSSLIPGGYAGGDYVGYARHADASEFWSASNPNGKYPEMTSKSAVRNDALLKATYLNDGSFVSVRNISLGYKFPTKWIQKAKISSLQIYGQVMNPFIFGGAVVKAGINPDDTNGWSSVNSAGDPTGGTNNNTMMVTSFVGGIRVSF